MKINNEFELKERVYLITDTDQLPRLIMALEVYPAGEILYKLCQKTTVSYHYGYELSRDKDVLLTTTN